jgi:16S rRNA (guanine966-N2)-methyltransferase
MRIIAGRHRGRLIDGPRDSRVRPTADRARQALFDILAHGAPGLRDAVVVDAFCGTGAFGLEALSRGARLAFFIDLDAAALRLARDNAKLLGEEAACRFIHRDALRPGSAEAACDIAFLDPPYGSGLGVPALIALSDAGWLKPKALAVIETHAGEAIAEPAGFAFDSERRYGKAKFTMLRRA